jgi:endonuclease/exonuclease/phosphatase (EEP) superfamily protein YafD
VHLPSPLGISGGSRSDELETVGTDAARSADPVLIAGDFNSYGKVAELERSGFAWLTRRLGDTTRVRFLGIPITSLSFDHFLASGLRLAPGTPALGVVSDNHGASDHLPIWALIESTQR